MDDTTVRAGLLLEAAEAQQASAAAALARLDGHTGRLDGIVREQIRATLLEELRELREEGERTAAALRALGRGANLRVAATHAAVAVLSAAVPLALAWWLLPAPAEIAALRGERDRMAATVARLNADGGRIQLRRCGAAQRLCVRVERAGPHYGEGEDYLVVKGY